MTRNCKTFCDLRIFPHQSEGGKKWALSCYVGKESKKEKNEFSFLLDSPFWFFFFLILGGKKKIRDFFFQIFIRIIWWNIGILYYTIYLDFSLTNQAKENITFVSFFFFSSFKNMVWIMHGILLLWQWFEGKWINYYLPIKSIF